MRGGEGINPSYEWEGCLGKRAVGCSDLPYFIILDLLLVTIFISATIFLAALLHTLQKDIVNF